MIKTGHVDRLWMVGGALGAVVMLAIGWFFLISPQNAQTATLQSQAQVAELRQAKLRSRLVELRTQNENLPAYKAQLTSDRQALPTTSGLSDFLRELQVAGDATAVSVSGLTIGAPTKVVGSAARSFAMPVTLTASGSGERLQAFLDQLQQVQPRAVLISNVSANADGEAGSINGAASVTITLQVFTTPRVGGGTAAAPAAD